MSRDGIAIAGSILVDTIKTISEYPEKNMLTDILEIERAVGGCVPNTSIDLASIDSEIAVSAYGRVGNDEAADFIIERLKQSNINTDGIIKNEYALTSFTDVFNEKQTGCRTFFSYPGASAGFCEADLDFENMKARMLHLGYLMLLPVMDSPDDEYGCRAARAACLAQENGIKVSVDTVSSNAEGLKRVVIPTLKFCNYVIMNETEVCAATGLKARKDNGELDAGNILKAMRHFISCGVKECVIVHCPEGGFYMDCNERTVKSGSLILPEGYIAGATGAGDAFCAAALYGLYNDFSPEEILKLGSASAALNLVVKDSVSGAGSFNDLKNIMNKFDTRKL
ncbi:MAG: carbohydrate kinase family protein [Clostridia bacterium]|nr:carbohydrate kinase family protein [Clostridia bacterium]